MRIDADAAMQRVADDVLFLAEAEVEQVAAAQEADARLLGRCNDLVDGILFQNLDLGRAELRRRVAFDLKALEADGA